MALNTTAMETESSMPMPMLIKGVSRLHPNLNKWLWICRERSLITRNQQIKRYFFGDFKESWSEKFSDYISKISTRFLLNKYLNYNCNISA